MNLLPGWARNYAIAVSPMPGTIWCLGLWPQSSSTAIDTSCLDMPIAVYEGNGNPLQYSCLENPMDRGAWQATVHWVTKSQMWLSTWLSGLQSIADCNRQSSVGFVPPGGAFPGWKVSWLAMLGHCTPGGGKDLAPRGQEVILLLVDWSDLSSLPFFFSYFLPSALIHWISMLHTHVRYRKETV